MSLLRWQAGSSKIPVFYYSLVASKIGRGVYERIVFSSMLSCMAVCELGHGLVMCNAGQSNSYLIHV